MLGVLGHSWVTCPPTPGGEPRPSDRPRADPAACGGTTTKTPEPRKRAICKRRRDGSRLPGNANWQNECNF